MTWERPDQPAVGTTVTLRVETPVGPIGVVGVLVDADGETWSVRRRDGKVSIVGVSAISASRVVPPSRAARASLDEVERIAALGWRSPEVQQLGDWLLRAGGGFTGRANSALALGDPGCSLEIAIDRVEQWYADRALPVRMQLSGAGAPSGLSALLDAREWTTSVAVHVMTAEVGHVLRAAPAAASADLELRVDDAPDQAWLAAYRQAGGALPAAACDILTNHPTVGFASLREGADAVAIARACVDDRWAGLFAVEVAPARRRLGLASLVSAAALRWAGQRGARRTYLQVSTDNTAAITLYERLGYAVHHDYLYRQAPDPS